MTRRQLWSSPHSNNKPDKWLEDFLYEAQEPCAECLETEKPEYREVK